MCSSLRVRCCNCSPSQVDARPMRCCFAAVSETSTKRSSVEFPRSAFVRDLFLHYVDITSTPKKAFVRMLAEYCSVAEDRAILMLLSGCAAGVGLPGVALLVTPLLCAGGVAASTF
jgi:hypothetical protein